MIPRIGGAVFVATAVLVAVHFVIEPLYHVSTEDAPYSRFWDVLDVLRAVTIAMGLVFAYLRKRAAGGKSGGGAVTREFLVANTLFYGLLSVGIMFYWNWFNLLSPAYTAVPAAAVSLTWMIIDAALPPLLGAIGVSLLRGGRDR
ncbi:MAG: hypothetical protein OXJ90_24810 [Spirochaetaceae bacterium]|nr:hypothetical protein [Spirochaetaceae bacterium]